MGCFVLGLGDVLVNPLASGKKAQKPWRALAHVLRYGIAPGVTAKMIARSQQSAQFPRLSSSLWMFQCVV